MRFDKMVVCGCIAAAIGSFALQSGLVAQLPPGIMAPAPNLFQQDMQSRAVDRELLPVQRALQLTDSELATIRAAAVASLNSSWEQLLTADPATASSDDSPGSTVQSAVADATQQHVDEARWKRYQTDQQHRVSFRRQIALRSLLTTLDQHLRLAPKQLRDIQTLLKPHWQSSWNAAGDAAGGQGNSLLAQNILMQLPAAQLNKILNEEQRNKLDQADPIPFSILLGRGPQDADLSEKRRQFAGDQQKHGMLAVQLRVGELQQVCQLSTVQAKRLKTAGHEIVRGEVKQRVEALSRLQTRQGGSFDAQAIRTLDQALTSSPEFQTQWQQAVAGVLSPKQQRAWNQRQQQRARLQTNTMLGEIIVSAGQSFGFTGQQHFQLQKMLSKQLASTAVTSQLDLVRNLAKVPNESFAGILDEAQWRPFKSYLPSLSATLAPQLRR